MKTFFVYIILILLSIPHELYTTDTTFVNYFPLEIGNTWTYRYESSSWPGYYETYDYKITVTDTSTIKNHFYYIFYNSHDSSYKYYRLDSSTGFIYQYIFSGCYNSEHEVSVDSLAAKLNNTFKKTCFWLFTTCTDTANYQIFNLNTKSKKYTEQWTFTDYRIYYKGIGLGKIYSGIVNPHTSITTHTLLGCKINNQIYGDTNLTLIYSHNNYIPKKFDLSQNYPNPFNPKTKIRFGIPSNVKRETSNVKLKIYDLLGREVAILVNEELKPGTYEADWDGSNYSSGVYFYKLEAGDFTETKKMVLMK